MLEGNNPNCSRLPQRYAISSPFFAAYFIISSAVLVIYSSMQPFFPLSAPIVTQSLSGGRLNTASGGGVQGSSSVSGGRQNTANGLAASVSGGQQNTASGNFSSVSGGLNRSAPDMFNWAA